LKRSGWSGAMLLALGLAAGAGARAAQTGELLYFPDDEKLRRIDIDTIDHGPLVEDVLIASTGDDFHALAGPRGGGNVNGKICMLNDGTHRIVMSEDAGQPIKGLVSTQNFYAPGWSVHDPDGRMVGKLVATYETLSPDPTGCAVLDDGRLLTLDAGDEGFGTGNGEMVLWFPPFDRFPGPGKYPNHGASHNYCKLAIDIGTATNVAIDELGRPLVTSPSSSVVYRYSGPLPTSPDAAGGCGRVDGTGAPLVDAGRLQQEIFISDDSIGTPSGLARGPNGNWFVGDVLFGAIGEFDANGAFVRLVLDPGSVTKLPTPYGNPQSLAFDSKGTLYYADLDLVGPLLNPDTGPDGKVRRIRFAQDGTPQLPEIVRSGLRFPDGVSVFPGNLEAGEWRTLGRTASRSYFNPDEHIVTQDNVANLVKRWSFPTAAIVTASPSVASIAVPDEGRVSLVLFPSWDGLVHAVRRSDGTELWHFQADEQPGAGYPGAGSVHVEEIDGTDRVFVAYGETMYSLDAATGHEIWRFVAGTGCKDAQGNPPGLCSFSGERNEIESTGAIGDGTLFFGMDINDNPLGKGGVFGVDARTGHMKWFFDLETASTCRPDPGDAVTHFDGYHSAAQLGLPPDFFATRSGCNFDRTPDGCGNTWSSPTLDLQRGLLYLDSANCDVDDDPATPAPPPPMPPYDEAIFALHFDGTPAWHWRPRDVDDDDYDFGGVPNLFTIQFGGASREVVGVGGKDGTYYVLDRDGVNEVNGVAWNDADPAALPYWKTNVVPGGAIGGIIASAAVDEGARRIYFSTAPGISVDDVFAPQTPTAHALDMDTGAVLWDSGDNNDLDNDASYGPTTGIPGVAFMGAVLTPRLRAMNAATGELLFHKIISSPGFSNSVASAAAVVDGTVYVGTGIGTRSGDPHDVGDQISREPHALVALCVPGTAGCGACRNGIDDDHDGYIDYPADPGCASADDPSEKGPDYACDDGIDNDGDGKIDMLDPGCPAPFGTTELTQCDDGIDNDGNGLVDFRDPKCSRAFPYWEKTPPTCGLGAELAALVPALVWLRKRRRG